jgi:DNA-binding PadR family transcriptional regulator
MKLLEENGKMYGYEITPKVKAITAGSILPRVLCIPLYKLEAEGILMSKLQKVDNRMRKYYKLTEAGEKETVNQLQS